MTTIINFLLSYHWLFLIISVGILIWMIRKVLYIKNIAVHQELKVFRNHCIRLIIISLTFCLSISFFVVTSLININ